jgi:tRNA (guanine10-N2)-methyltransferase
MDEQKAIIETFSYMNFKGPIRLRNPEETFIVHELWTQESPKKLARLYFGRLVRISSSKSGLTIF